MSGREGVMRTARDAMRCKASSDGGVRRQTPLMNRVYHTRSNLMLRGVYACAKMITHHKDETSSGSSDSVDSRDRSSGGNSSYSRCKQMLVLGAGLDESIDKVCARLESEWKVFAVDYREVLSQRDSIVSSESCRSCTIPVAADLSNVDELNEKLQSAGFDWNSCTVVVTEVVLGYLETEDVKHLLRYLNTKAQAHILHISFDPLLSPEPEQLATSNLSLFQSPCKKDFSSDLRHMFRKRGAPLRHSCTSASSQARFFRNQGLYSHAGCITASDLLACFPTGNQPLEEEPFDEFHALALTNKHYGLTIACNDNDLWRSTMHSFFAPSEDMLEPFESKRSWLLKTMLDTIPDQTVFSQPIIGNVIIRPASSSDFSSIFALLMSGFSDAAKKYPSVRKFIKTAKKQIAREAETETCWMLVAVADGDIVGCAGIRRSIDSGSVIELQHMVVSERIRRQGLGSQLLMETLKLVPQLTKAPTDGAIDAQVHLSVVSEMREAQALYTLYGFKEKERETLKDGCVLIHMVKVLPYATYL